MIKNKRVFLTGGTGFLGSYLLKLLLLDNNMVYVLARGGKNIPAKLRVINMLKFWDKDAYNIKTNKLLEVIDGDIVFDNLGFKKNIEKKLINEVEIILHSAALAELRTPLQIIRKINVNGTKNLLDFALKCKNLVKFNHISTAYVVGTKQGIVFTEDMLEINQKFYNTYEQSKFEAELLIINYLKKRFNVAVFRPSMVMGDSIEGKTTNFRLFYEPLHFFSKRIFEEFPANLQCSQNLINIDTVAKAILLLGERKEDKVYHITTNNIEDVNLLTFLNLASNFFKIKMPKFIPIEKFDFSKWTPMQKILADPYIPYFNYRTIFSSEKTQKVINEYNFAYPTIDEKNLLRIFEYCLKVGFIKKG